MLPIRTWNQLIKQLDNYIIVLTISLYNNNYYKIEIVFQSSNLTGITLVAQMIKNLPVMWDIWVWSLGQEDSLEKEMVIQSSILAWEIPWTEEPGGLQFMELQRITQDWATNTNLIRPYAYSSNSAIPKTSWDLLPCNCVHDQFQEEI